MRATRLLLCLVGLLLTRSAAAQAPPADYYGAQKRYTTGDVLSVFGKAQQKPARPELLFDVGVNAGVHTKVNCGRLGVDLNLGGIARRVSQIPQQIASQANALVGALPMLTVCYASPALCAELKNLNFQINERIKGLSDVCRSIDATIASQSASEMGQAAARKRGWEDCVRGELEGGATEDEAQEACNNAPPRPLYTDMARAWLADATTNRAQNVIQSLLEASGQRLAGVLGDGQYRFLSSVLGELKLDVNGKVLPVFPAHPATATDLRVRMQRMGVDLACNPARLRVIAEGMPGPGGPVPITSVANPPEARLYETALFEVTQEKLTREVGDDLEVLDPPDRALACNALGRSLGRMALQRTAANGQAIMELAIQNPAMPENLRQMYEGRASRTFKVLLEEAYSPPEKSLESLSSVINKMASNVRQARRNTAAELSKGLQDMESEFRTTPCDSEETCEP